MMGSAMVENPAGMIPAHELSEGGRDDRHLPLFALAAKLDEGFMGRPLEHPVSSESATIEGYGIR